MELDFYSSFLYNINVVIVHSTPIVQHKKAYCGPGKDAKGPGQDIKRYPLCAIR